MNTTTENSVVTYKCINGYRFHENITSRTCLASGNWTEGNISCIKIDDDCEGSDCGLSAGVLAAIICGAGFIPLSCLVAVAGCVVRLRLQKLKKSENILSLTSTEASTLPLHHTVTNQSPVQQLQEELRIKNMLIPKSQLRLGRVVGQGESGIVYCGYMKSSQGNEVVAIKTVKALLAVNDKDRLLKEVLLMLNFNHPNVMSLIGLSFEGETPLLIMPFMSKGNVLGYVREHRETLFLTDIDHEKVQEATKTGLGMCYQISKGMAYLAKFKFVHRDLAARNCMIDWNDVIKVSDFGLTEDMYSYNYFRPKSTKGGEEKLPIKWMAPESIETNIFNETTDVWSFGVTCWEVFTCGGVPYAGVPVTTLLSELRSGHRLDRPSNISCSDDIWSVVTSCWSASPQERPKFATLVNTLTDLLDSDSNYIKLLG
ncbi:Tyrosine-protein kinase transforming protein SEA [Geodia barretti]|uniref:Tyrosine-protein kinase transforming protein SEA n=1 Tax=Geodia barretti TaxID=519541 RepID=A0AA35XD26_GEOBA|nr:Tyrosine-protein kinase transforming protein SEA [Geodia barretti]